jgi:CRISPR system Cascade subunit CasD
MALFLVLRLTGPLMSFGDTAVDETRPTAALPGQSMLAGLVANALGYRAREGARLNRLEERLVYGARRDRPGERFTDYQNAHVQCNQTMWRWRTPGPLKRGGGTVYDNTQRYRDYVADGAVTVVLTFIAPDESPGLEDVARALVRPARPLFLGRAGCPPSGLLYRGERVEALSVFEALALVPAFDGAAQGDFFAQWPAEGMLSGPAGVERRVVERPDLRDFVSDLHAGGRLVAQGIVRPLAEQAKEG